MIRYYYYRYVIEIEEKFFRLLKNSLCFCCYFIGTSFFLHKNIFESECLCSTYKKRDCLRFCKLDSPPEATEEKNKWTKVVCVRSLLFSFKYLLFKRVTCLNFNRFFSLRNVKIGGCFFIFLFILRVPWKIEKLFWIFA